MPRREKQSHAAVALWPGEKIPKPTVLRYMQEAMKLVDDGKEIKPEKTKPGNSY